MTQPLSRLFNPRSVALLGATDRSTWSQMAFANLKLLGFEGQVHLVSRNGGPAHGRQTLRSAAEIAEPVDVAVLMLPNTAIGDALRDLAAASIPFAVVLAGGFTEIGEDGTRLQQEMVASARSLGITLLGPNSLGMINFGSRAVCWTGAMRTPPLRGGISIVSQSGAVASVMMHFSHQHGIGLNIVAAMGNEAMLGLAEVVDHLIDDRATRVIALFIETVRNPPLFRAAAGRALRAGKPIVVLKVGRSEAAMQAAQSHTGSLVGDDDVFAGVCHQLGVVRVDSIEELMFTAALLDKTGVLPDAGVALLSASGGMGELAADYAQAEGLRLAELSAETWQRLRAVLPAMATPANPLDLTGAVVAKPELFQQCMEVLQRDPAVSVLVALSDLPTGHDGDWSPYAIGCMEAIGSFAPDGRARFLVVSNTLKAVSERGRALIASAYVPYLGSGLDLAMRALRHADRWSARHRSAQSASIARAKTPTPAQRLRSERESMEFLHGFGVPVAPQVLATSAQSAVAAARSMDGPVVLKIASPDIAHKTEVGGVLLNLHGDDAVEAGFFRIMNAAASGAPGARLEGVVVSPMRTKGLELFVGVRLDAQWGLVMALGLGGVWIEALQDVSLRPLPVSAADVAQMVGELRGARLLQGFRGSAPVDMVRLAEVVTRIGDAALALGPALDTLEINPLLVDGVRIEALDALVTYTS